MNSINKKLEYIKANNLYRKIKYLSESQDKYTTVDGMKVLLMSSNNYLGLSNNEDVKQSAIEAIQKYGLGSGGSRLTTGSYDLHRKLERKIAEFKNYEDALIFNTGYMANLGVISAICDENYYIFSDELNHASIVDGCRLSKGETIVYKHNNVKDLENKIKALNPSNGIIVSDSVFSMDGDICNFDKIYEISKRYNLLTILDDAHATGVIGKTGRGSSEYFKYKPDITIGTLSKAIGSEGGFVCASESIIDFLRNKARSFIFSTALSHIVISGAIKSLEIIDENIQLVEKLSNNISYACKRLNEIGFEIDIHSPIIPILIGDEEKAVKLSELLLENGIFIPAIRNPTVKKGCTILRLTLMSTHNYEDIDYVIDIINKYKLEI
ncbi:8-amino-7-oxononanoate synthase [Romboutsia sp. 1001713B170207_170306_H8]|uniref:8-amino-7-oxononanoate synthase n=1 Tax=Romboutsia sp. 1001713B170207_170306_H8 TaxID=2787112 RepID=UPI00189B155A|nr:8-amino-7-oxononanoate synthase [Romboutsia sp. 1001713B170207_170306_H8]